MARQIELKPYPKSMGRRTGSKVSWEYFETEADAKQCAEAARHNATELAKIGYDYGFQVPGTIRAPTADREWWPNEWEVCIP